MTERPILFSTAMVRAIVNGEKIETRRLVKTRKDGTERVYAEVGDVLWVRETWGLYKHRSHRYDVVYRANYADDYVVEDVNGVVKFRPSIHLPRARARLFLRVTSVHAEPLQQLTFGGAVDEGVPGLREFRELWDSLNAKRGASWESNPRVWVVRFEVIQDGR